ncbi:GPW/gp25 family protein [Brevibacillus laterosporus]|uniref:GPW/gp25 family protein n=1 Tax=Brevibacillus laterosporus TaxID=1465 RepID=UPI003D1FE127
MEHEVALDEDIDFGATGLDEIKQNLRTICSTFKGSVPLDRGFGITPSLVDYPIEISKAHTTADIMAAIQKYEPRVKVTRITFTQDHTSSRLIPHIRFILQEEV